MLNYSATLDRTFRALADPGRRSMVERLCRGPASVGELARPLDMTLSAVVQHLAVLEACGLVRSAKVGRVRTCHVEPAALGTAERWIAARRRNWERRFGRLGALLAQQPEDPTQLSNQEPPDQEPPDQEPARTQLQNRDRGSDTGRKP